MSYLALYRKHRPKNFDGMVGQEVVIKTLKNAIKLQKIHHCYLLSGNKGVGKTTLAKILAKAINCQNPQGQDCCNECESCLAVHQKANLDVIEIDGASYNGVDEIRELKDTAQYKSHLLKYKVYIIDEVHVLSNNAFNALLKLLEEPPVNVVFVLITSELAKIPKTILSRTQHFYLPNLTDEEIKTKLNPIAEEEKILITDEALNTIAAYSDGSMRDALNLLDKISSYKTNLIEKKDIEKMLGVISESKINQLAEYLVQPDINQMITFLELILKPNVQISPFLDDLIDFFQKLLLEHVTNPQENTNLFRLLTNSKRNEFFEILLTLKQNIIHFPTKKNSLILNFIKIHNLFFDKNIIIKKTSIAAKNINTVVKNHNCNNNVSYSNNDLPCTKKEPKKSYLAKKKEIVAEEAIESENHLIKHIKKILLNQDDKTTTLLKKRWANLKTYSDNLELEASAKVLSEAKFLMIGRNKEMLLACSDMNNYKNLLNVNVKKNIKKLFNSKKTIINDYFVILPKHWDEVIKVAFDKYQTTNNPMDVDLSHLDNIFYEQNSLVKIEQNELELIKLAREYFGFDTVKIKI
ncbi:MAG: DNA polymerase III subunits gamma and tau [Candidatus Phytoplasma pruni]|uniref:DNA polymerase III subunit gamma/tau n=1 Tax=Poinsettia branch-inducing phytoplasma TaxID=138647 RepID=UPI0003694776|nr:DNA polymerase III subunit gamma/tau [Poinsettia branch-inducing phytoplasma]WEK82752.1 MAG: DNA polymerase III subunits gamma and tau [Candidatus Phytoplasma pruni]